MLVYPFWTLLAFGCTLEWLPSLDPTVRTGYWISSVEDIASPSVLLVDDDPPSHEVPGPALPQCVFSFLWNGRRRRCTYSARATCTEMLECHKLWVCQPSPKDFLVSWSETDPDHITCMSEQTQPGEAPVFADIEL